MTKDEAKVLFNYYDTLITKLTEAKLALVSGGVKSYTIDNRSLTRFDIDSLGSEIEDAVKKRDIYRAIMNGGKSRKAFAIVPRDF
ncbi:MAG: hypothetical protein E7671_00595 [Ruminococcaceae bacterium]|nr:hypothetical protein [Oscillospiraceae bacterium]